MGYDDRVNIQFSDNDPESDYFMYIYYGNGQTSSN
jgi:hypothetical protein